MAELPRRVFIDRQTPAELAIREAIVAVDKLGPHPMLTDAAMLLSRAHAKVAHYADRRAGLG